MKYGRIKTSTRKLIQKLERLDEDILRLWVDDESTLNDEERWEVFVVLLESRVALLKTCIDAKIELKADEALPGWLVNLSSSRKILRLRELKKIYKNLKKRRQIRAFEKIGQERDAE